MADGRFNCFMCGEYDVWKIYIKRMFRTLSGRKRFFVAFKGIGEWKSGNDSL